MLASSLGIRGAEYIADGVAILGLLLTVFLLPEPKGSTLEQLRQTPTLPPC